MPDWWSAITPTPTPAPAAGAQGGDVESRIRSVAAARGFSNPELLLATARQESGLNPLVKGGDAGKSWGLYQEHDAGRGRGLSVPQRQDVEASTERAINEFNAIRQRFPDVDLGTWAAKAQRPLDPTGYARSVNALLGQQSAVAPAAAAAPPPAASPVAARPSGGAPAWWSAVSASPAARAAPAAPDAAPAARKTNDVRETPGWLELAQTQLGKPYIWGSAGGRSNFSLDAPGYDCSGFVAQVYRNAFGVNIPAFTGSAYPATKAVAQQEAQPGDLVFWNMGTPDPRRQHVALYIGGGKVIQSGGAGNGVNIAPVNQMPGAEFRRSPEAFARYGGDGGEPGRSLPATAPKQPQQLDLQGTAAPAWWTAVSTGSTR